MNKTLKILIISLFGIGGQQAHASIAFNFDYTYDNNNFFDTVAKKAALEVAGSYFSNRINDTFGAITSSGGNQFDAGFFHPATGAYSLYETGFSVGADTITIFAGGRDLPGTTLGVGGPGGWSASGSAAFFSSINRGQVGVGVTDFAPWGGSLSFDTAVNWYFDDDVSTVDVGAGQNDFYSVAIHELGHLLGLGLSDSWNNQVSGGEFTGANSVLANSGNNIVLNPGGDHWAEGTLSLVDGLSQEASMDPTVTVGDRKYFTDLDVAALRDVGWEVTTVPVPAAVYFFGSALLGLGSFRKKQSK